MTTFNYPAIPQSITQVIKNGFTLYKSSFSKVFVWQLLFGIVICIPPRLLLTNPSLHLNITLELLIGFVCFLVSQFTSLLILRLIQNTAATQDTRLLSTTFGIAFKKFFPSVIGLLILGIGFGIVAGIIGFMAGMTSGLSGSHPDLAFTITSIFLILIAVYFGTIFAFYNPSILFIGTGIFASMKQCFRIVRGCWWRTFCTLFIVSIIAILAPQLLAHVLSGGSIFASVIIYWLLNSITAPFWLATLLVLFFDLKQRHQAPVINTAA